jgi:hypothetical protein
MGDEARGHVVLLGLLRHFCDRNRELRRDRDLFPRPGSPLPRRSVQEALPVPHRATTPTDGIAIGSRAGNGAANHTEAGRRTPRPAGRAILGTCSTGQRAPQRIQASAEGTGMAQSRWCSISKRVNLQMPARLRRPKMPAWRSRTLSAPRHHVSPARSFPGGHACRGTIRRPGQSGGYRYRPAVRDRLAARNTAARTSRGGLPPTTIMTGKP